MCLNINIYLHTLSIKSPLLIFSWKIDFFGRGHPEVIERESEGDRQYDEETNDESHTSDIESETGTAHDLCEDEENDGDEEEGEHHRPPTRFEPDAEKTGHQRRDGGIDADHDE